MKLNKYLNYKTAGALLAVLILAALGLYSHYKRASGAQGDPEVTLEELSGVSRNAFSIDETGYLKLRAYSERIEGYEEKLDIILMIDSSRSMCAGTGRLSSAKTIAKDFINGIGTSDGVNLGVVRFDTAATTVRNLTSVSSNAVKNQLRANINSISCANVNRTELGEAVAQATAQLQNNGRADATRYVLLLSDGAENQVPAANGSFFTAIRAADPTTDLEAGSALQVAQDEAINYVSVFTGAAANTCAGSDVTEQSLGCALMRFVATRTNDLELPATQTNWTGDFGSVAGIDNNYFYKSQHTSGGDLYTYIQGTTGVKLQYFIRLPVQVGYETVVEAVDKGGRTRDVSVNQISPNYYQISTNRSLPDSYRCTLDETACTDVAALRQDGTYWVEDNYLDLKIRIKFTGLGVFDAISNYIGCEAGPLHMVGQDSRVEYYDPRNSQKYKTLYFKSACVRVAESSPYVVKTSYESDPGDDLANPVGTRQASFDAGADVFVVLEIDDSTSGRTDFIIEDNVPESVSGKLEYTYYQGTTKIKSGEVVVEENKIKFHGQDDGSGGEVIGSLSGSKNFIKYKFRI